MLDYLVVDMKSVLDRSRAGREGGATLASEWERWKGLPDGAERLEQRRAQLRAALLHRAGEVVRKLAQERQAATVFERGAVLLCPPERDVTEAVIAALDAAT
jgi:Skp family chaperone for outer membrane proteins